MKAGAVRTAEHRLASRLLFDLVIFVLLTIPIIICEVATQPFQRGFFCSDETIRYPFRNNTVTAVMLSLLITVVPILTILIAETTRFYRRGRIGESVLLFGWKLPIWLVECAKHMFYFCFGANLTFNATEIGKYTVGRLRPHFIAVCQPQLLDGSSCASPRNSHRYVENYICLAKGYTAFDVRQARLSFPSGHSSLSFFAMVYLTIYIQHKFSWHGSKLARYFLQFSFLMVAWFTALTRIMDNWHHWSDVLCGSLLGAACAIITALYITKDFGTPLERLRVNIPRQDTCTTLDEIITTPPPYTLSGRVDDMPVLNRDRASSGRHSFTNEQYSTKV